MIVLRILCPIDERHDALVQFLAQELNVLAVSFEFGAIPFPELFPSVRVVSKPFPQFRAGGNIFQPQIDACFFLCQTPRPKPVHENTLTVMPVRLLINSFDSDGHDLGGFRPDERNRVRLTKDSARLHDIIAAIMK